MKKLMMAFDVVLVIVGAVLLATGSFAIGTVLLVVGISMLSLLPFAGLLGGGKRTRYLQAHGVAATAQIMGLDQTGTYINNQPVVGFTFRVHAPGRPPMDVRHKQVVPQIALGSIGPGRSLGVLLDPADPTNMVIDWNSIAPNIISLDGGPEFDLAGYPGAAIALRQLIASSGRAAQGQVDLRSDPELKARARAILQQYGVPVDAGPPGAFPPPAAAPAPAPGASYAPPAPPAPAPEARDKDAVAERLRELDQLRASDLLSPEEYDAQRRRILDGL